MIFLCPSCLTITAQKNWRKYSSETHVVWACKPHCAEHVLAFMRANPELSSHQGLIAWWKAMKEQFRNREARTQWPKT